MLREGRDLLAMSDGLERNIKRIATGWEAELHIVVDDLIPYAKVVDLAWSITFFICVFSMIVGAISFLPGGLGGTELTMVTLLMLNRVEAPEAVALTVLIRVTTLWFAVLLGIVALLRDLHH